jgi:hypothetical protein
VLTCGELAGIALSYGIIFYVVKPPRHVLWGFHIFAAACLVEEIIRKIRSARSLPQGESSGFDPHSAVAPRRVEFSAAPKTGDGSKYLWLLGPGFALGGAITLAFNLFWSGIFERSALSDIVGPGCFLFIGAYVTWVVGRQSWVTRNVLRDPVAVVGVVTSATESGLRYRFSDLAGLEHTGEGTEYSGDYYEEMEVPVVYERGNPKNNLPMSALYDDYEVTVKP